MGTICIYEARDEASIRDHAARVDGAVHTEITRRELESPKGQVLREKAAGLHSMPLLVSMPPVVFCSSAAAVTAAATLTFLNNRLPSASADFALYPARIVARAASVITSAMSTFDSRRAILRDLPSSGYIRPCCSPTEQSCHGDDAGTQRQFPGCLDPRRKAPGTYRCEDCSPCQQNNRRNDVDYSLHLQHQCERCIRSYHLDGLPGFVMVPVMRSAR
jgi:hypothetical protein